MIACLMAAPLAFLAILYSGGFLGQILGNYAAWKQGGGIPGDGTSPVAAVARLFYLPDLSAAPSLWGIRCSDLHRPTGYPAPDGDEDGLQ